MIIYFQEVIYYAKYCETFAQVEKKVDFINNQLTLFDFLKKGVMDNA